MALLIRNLAAGRLPGLPAVSQAEGKRSRAIQPNYASARLGVDD